MTMPNALLTQARMLLLGQVAAADTSLPRQRDAKPVQQRPAGQETPTDALFERLPEGNPQQFQAQTAGDGGPELERALRDSVPGYRKNPDLLLRLKL